MSALESAQKLKAQFGDLISEPTEFRGEWTVKLADAEKIAEVCAFAKKELGFDYLVDISSVDNYGEDPRWTVVYELSRLAGNVHLRLKTDVSEEKSELPTVTGVWRTADWHEREIYDMMGIRFRGHPDLMWRLMTMGPLRFTVGGWFSLMVTMPRSKASFAFFSCKHSTSTFGMSGW